MNFCSRYDSQNEKCEFIISTNVLINLRFIFCTRDGHYTHPLRSALMCYSSRSWIWCPFYDISVFWNNWFFVYEVTASHFTTNEYFSTRLILLEAHGQGAFNGTNPRFKLHMSWKLCSKNTIGFFLPKIEKPQCSRNGVIIGFTRFLTSIFVISIKNWSRKVCFRQNLQLSFFEFFCQKSKNHIVAEIGSKLVLRDF